MRRFYRQAFKSPNQVVTFMQILESRLDNIIWRLGCAPTMAAARYIINGMHVQYRRATRVHMGEEGWRTQPCVNTMMSIGDQIRIRPRESSIKAARRFLEEEGNIPIPDHLDWDPENLVCTYTGVCDANDFGIDVEEHMIKMWYTGSGGWIQKAVRRKHIRYQPGTNKVIHKKYNGGRPRATPENLYNMAKGLGIRRKWKGVSPCVWGRIKPLNNPYEVTRRDMNVKYRR